MAAHLEGHGEGCEALGEEPDDGVEGPDDDGQPRDLSVQFDDLRILQNRSEQLRKGD